MTKIPRQLAKNKITSLNLKNKKKTKDDLNAENYLKIDLQMGIYILEIVDTTDKSIFKKLIVK